MFLGQADTSSEVGKRQFSADTHMTWKGQLGVWTNLSSRMLLCGTVLTVERHQHLSTRLMGLAGEELKRKKKEKLNSAVAVMLLIQCM